MATFKYSPLDFLLTSVGLVFLLLDIVLDVYAAVSLFQEKAYFSLGLSVLFLVGSSVLVQAYSWLWYSYEDFRRDTKLERAPSLIQLKILHIFQLGIYLRHLGVFEMSLRSLCCGKRESGSVAVFLSHDLAMLRIIETFSESLPQLVLMATTIVRHRRLDPGPVLKAAGSAAAVAFTVTMYHRSLRSFLPDGHSQNLLSSAVYFLWNLLLISSRVAALALFASVLPCFIFTHFFCSWLVLLFAAWCSRTSFMDSPGGEWLYRATVGLIWYFNWFNVAEGSTRSRTSLYHSYVFIDICLLCGLWFWKMTPDLPDFNMEHVIVSVCIPSVYILGLLSKAVYYKFFHPRLYKKPLKSHEEETLPSELESPLSILSDEVDSSGRDPESSPKMMFKSNFVTDRSIRANTDEEKTNKRMRKLAQNFYS